MNIDANLDILVFLRDNTFQTGSMAYGLPNPKDHDRFCVNSTLELLKEKLKSYDVGIRTGGKSGGTSHAIIFTIDGIDYNVFAVQHDEIEIIKAVTEMVRVALKHMPLSAQQKPYWVHLFRTTRDTLTLWKTKGNTP